MLRSEFRCILQAAKLDGQWYDNGISASFKGKGRQKNNLNNVSRRVVEHRERVQFYKLH